MAVICFVIEAIGSQGLRIEGNAQLDVRQSEAVPEQRLAAPSDADTKTRSLILEVFAQDPGDPGAQFMEDVRHAATASIVSIATTRGA